MTDKDAKVPEDERIRRALEEWTSYSAPTPSSPELIRARGTGRVRRRRAAAAATAVAAVAALVVALAPITRSPVRAPARAAAATRSIQQLEAKVGHVALTGDVLAEARQAARSELTLMTKMTGALYRQAGTTDNVLLAPTSLAQVLVQLELGAHGATAEQLSSALGMTSTPASEQAVFWNALGTEMNRDEQQSASADVQLEQRNGLFLERHLKVRPTYLNALARDFGEGIWEANFADHPAAAARAISKWAQSASHLRIPPVLPPGSVNRRTEFVIASAFHFQAPWVSSVKFLSSATKAAPFQLSDGRTVSVEMMHLASTRLPAGSADGMRGVELPYAGGRFSGLAIEPQSGSLADMLSNWSPTSLAALVAALRSVPVTVSLPRLAIESANSDGSALQSIGVRAPFSVGADFGGITQSPVSLAVVGQSSMLDVTEHGTNAGGASAGSTALESGNRNSIVLDFDRPFVFLIRDDATGAVVFEAVVADPAALQP